MDQSKDNQAFLADIKETARKFLDRETAGGLLLIAATIIALIIGNSSWATAYHHFLKDEFLFKLTGHFTFSLTIEEWINDGLMAVFFLAAGMELKREIMVGELSSFKKASLPLMAALGGMVVPALIFASFNAHSESAGGWGIPMATDIAYSLGIIALLGKRVPAQLKIFLVALAIADDLGAILVIALFYSKDISLLFLGSGMAVFLLLLLMNRLRVNNLFWYILAGIVLWYCFLNSGIHPTIAGVLFAISIPVKPKLDSKLLKDRIGKHASDLEKTNIETRDPMEDRRQRKILRAIKRDAQNARPPLLKLENALIDFNVFLIIPIFALANAGVKLDLNLTEVVSSSLGLGIILGLSLGKVLGISIFAFLGEKLGISELHPSLRWKHIVGIGMIAGIGFTMSLFITNLAFSDPELIKVSKISILIASFIAAIAGVLILLFTKVKKDSVQKVD
jgi:NhaA family Na+:H+ antiporter